MTTTHQRAIIAIAGSTVSSLQSKLALLQQNNKNEVEVAERSIIMINQWVKLSVDLGTRLCQHPSMNTPQSTERLDAQVKSASAPLKPKPQIKVQGKAKFFAKK